MSAARVKPSAPGEPRTKAEKMVEHIRANPGHVSNCDERGRMLCVTCGAETISDPGAGHRR